MQYYKGKVTLFEKDFTDIGIPVKTIRSFLNRNRSEQTPHWSHVKDESDGRVVHIFYDNLPDKYKAKVKEKLCGGAEPFKYLYADRLSSLIKTPLQDIETISTHIFTDGSVIGPENQESLKRACGYLNLLVIARKRYLKKIGYTRSTDFWNDLMALVKTDKKLPANFPNSYNRLQMKKVEYKKQGALAIISKHRGRAYWRKIGEPQKAFIREVHSKQNIFDAEKILIMLNKVGVDLGWMHVKTATAIRNYIEEIETELSRKGKNDWRNANDYIVHRHRPKRPNMLWVGDGTPYELYYQTKERDENNRLVRKHWNRYVVYVVIDAFNDLVVGFSVGHTETSALAERAWKNACLNTKVMPQQIKTDNFVSADLKKIFQQLAYNDDFFTPSAVGNARDKVIEPFFAKIYDMVTRFHKNASGRGIRAKEQTNRDYLVKQKGDFPFKDEAIDQIIWDMTTWNETKRDKLDGKSLVDKWNEGDHSKDRAFTDMQRLQIFGKQHILKNRDQKLATNKLTNEGIVFTKDKTKRYYMRFDDLGLEFYKRIGQSFQIVYDPDDFSSIMVRTPDERFLWFLPEVKPIPMAFGDFEKGDRTRLNEILRFKDRVKRELVVDAAENRKKILQKAGAWELMEAVTQVKVMPIQNGQQKISLYEAQNRLKDLDGTDHEIEGDIYDTPIEIKQPEFKKDKEFDDGY